MDKRVSMKAEGLEDLEHIEHLLRQSLNGLHVLFDHGVVAKILQTPVEDTEFFKSDRMEKIQDVFNGLIQRKSFHEKRNYLESLDPESFEILVRTYFHLVESTLKVSSKIQH